MMDESREVAASFLAHNMKAGDVVAFIGDPDAEWLLLQLGVMRAGGTVALIPQVQDERTLGRMLAFAGAKFVLATSEADVSRILPVMKTNPGIVQIILQHGTYRTPKVVRLDLLLQSGPMLLAEKPHEMERREAHRTPEDVAVIAFSAGTMAMPRAFPISQARLAQQVADVAEQLGKGPSLVGPRRMDLLDQCVLMWSAFATGRELFLGLIPDHDYEWITTADELADTIFTRSWPVTGPEGLPKGMRGWLFRRETVKRLKERMPHLAGAHLGFSVPPAPIVRLFQGRGGRLTWGYGLVEAYGFCTWEENRTGYGTVLPHMRLAIHDGTLVFDWADGTASWWQSTGDWARTVGPWIAELEPHGTERGDVPALSKARQVERDLVAHPWVAAAFVSGPEPLSDLAMVTLREPVVRAWALTQGLDAEAEWSTLVRTAQIQEPVLARMRAVGHRFGKWLDPHIVAEGLSEESGERTARGEFRRAVVMRRASQHVKKPRPEMGH